VSCPPLAHNSFAFYRAVRAFAFSIGLFALLLTNHLVQAQTWTGGGADGNWSTAANWTGGTPVSSSSTDLIFAGNSNVGTLATPLNQNIANPFRLDNLTFSAGGGAFFLGGSAFEFNGGINNSITQNSASAVNIANDISPSANATTTITLNGTGTGVATLSGVISAGSGNRDYAIVKNGSSTFSLTGANTYAGGTTINGGTLIVNSASSLGAASGTLTLNAGTLEVAAGYSTSRNFVFNNAASTIQVDSSQTFTILSPVTGTGGLIKNGTGTLSLFGTNLDTFTGTTTVNAGTLILAKNAGDATNNYGGALRGDLIINSGATVSVQNNSQVDDTKNIWINGGTFDLTTWTDGTSTGGIQFTGGNMTGSSSSIFRLGGTLTTNATTTTATVSGTQLWLNLASGADFNIAQGTTPSGIDLSVSGVVADGLFGNSFIKDGAGTMCLSGANTYTGSATVNAGALNIQSATALGTTAGGTTVNNGAALQIQGGIAVGAEALTLNGTGVGNTGALRNITGNNSWSGNVTLGSASTISSDTGILTLSGNLTNGGFALTTGGAGNVVASGVVSGSGGLTKTGIGTLTLSGANTYTGSTTVNAGSVFVNGSTASASAVAVNNSATTLGGSGTISGAVTVASGANLSPGATGGGSTAVLHTGALSLSSGSNFVLDLNNTTAGTGYDQVSVTGAINITGSNLVITPGAGLSIGDKFYIVANDGADAITGTFSQGATVWGGGDIFSINYADNFDGGAVANDISLTFIGLTPEFPTWLAGIVALAAIGHGVAARVLGIRNSTDGQSPMNYKSRS
jgi:fibronectin-binding autotransporter adhesin